MSKVVRLERARPQARGVATRRRVLVAAESLFARRGYEATAMADVAERAGIGVGTLYHHFPDKRALLLALIDDWGDRELAKRRPHPSIERFLGEHARAAFADDLRRSYERLCREGGFYLVLLELAERDSDKRLLPYCQQNRIAVIANRPFAEGAMFRRVRGKPLPPWAAEIGVASWAQYFLKWIVSHPAVTCAIPGTGRPDHMRDNLVAGHGIVPDEKGRKRLADYFDDLA